MKLTKIVSCLYSLCLKILFVGTLKLCVLRSGHSHLPSDKKSKLCHEKIEPTALLVIFYSKV